LDPEFNVFLCLKTDLSSAIAPVLGEYSLIRGEPKSRILAFLGSVSHQVRDVFLLFISLTPKPSSGLESCPFLEDVCFFPPERFAAHFHSDVLGSWELLPVLFCPPIRIFYAVSGTPLFGSPPPRTAPVLPACYTFSALSPPDTFVFKVLPKDVSSGG